MNNSKIDPEKVKSPYQLLGACLAGLVLLDGLFLYTAIQMTSPLIFPILLVSASILFVPLFLYFIFKLQTKHRKGMLSDEYYLTYQRMLLNKQNQEQEEINQKVKDDVAEDGLNQELHSISDKIHWENVGDLFWLGNDLMWIQDMMNRRALPERVLEGIEKVRDYSISLGFNDSELSQLTLAQTILKSLEGFHEINPTIQNIIEQKYKDVNKYITHYKFFINALVEQNQPGFKKR